MKDALTKVFKSFTGGVTEITAFSGWHIMYIVLIVGLTIGAAFMLKNKADKTKNRTLNILAYLVIGSYILDFFLMPFSEGKINIDKLPFHICTLVGVFIPFVQFNKKFKPIKDVVACLAIVASLMYITYPGSALGGVSAFSYKVIQTFVFHGLVFAWGVLTVTTKSVNLSFKKIWKEAVAIVVIAAWATVGNVCYNTSYTGADGLSHFDWFFLTGSSFGMSPWLMPFLTMLAIFAMCAIIMLIDFVTKKIIAKHKEKRNNIKY